MFLKKCLTNSIEIEGAIVNVYGLAFPQISIGNYRSGLITAKRQSNLAMLVREKQKLK